MADRSLEEQQRIIDAAHMRRYGATYPPRPADGACQCCGEVARLVLDHCHASGVFRGWICDPCNVGIGQLGDNIAGLEQALVYLRR